MATCFCCSPSHLFCHFFDWLHTGAVQVVVVLPRLNEQMVLNRFLHFFPWRYEMIVSVIHFVISLWSRRVWKWKWKFNRDASITGRIRDLTISLQCFTFQTKHNICKHTNTHTHTHTHMNSVQQREHHKKVLIESFRLSGRTFRFRWTVQDLKVFLV